MTLSESAARVAVLKTLNDVVAARYEDARREVLDAMLEQGAERLSAALPDGTKVAQIGISERKASITLDEDAFMAWVEDNHPDEIVQRAPTVRSSFRAAITARLAIVGDDVVDTTTGEKVTWAQVSPVGDPYPTTKLLPGGKDAIVAAWQSGAISLDALSTPQAIES